MPQAEITETDAAANGCRCFWVTFTKPISSGSARAFAGSRMSGYARARGLGPIALIGTEDGGRRFLYSVAAKVPGPPPMSADQFQRDVTGDPVYVHVPEIGNNVAFIQIGDGVRLHLSTDNADRQAVARTVTDLRAALDGMQAHLQAYHHARTRKGKA